MAGVTAAITIEDTEVNAALARVEEAGGNTLALMQDISGAMLFSVQRRFETETAPSGQPWPRHAPGTARARLNRKRRGRSGGNQPLTPRLLRDTNRFYKSIVAEASERDAATGTNLAYAAIHQQGGTITQYPQSRKVRFRKAGSRLRFAKKTHKRAFEKPVTFGQRTIVIPARPYLGFSDEDRAELLRLAEVHFEMAASGDAEQ